MLTKTITYTDYDNNERTEVLYFNMNQLELTEFAAELPEDLFDTVGDADVANLNNQTAFRIVEKLGAKGIIDFIKKLVLDSYGVKSEDGRRFIKKPELREEFSQTIAFDTFMAELMSDDTAAANFVNAIIPASMADKLATKRAEIEATSQG